MFDQLNAVTNNFVETLFTPFAKVLLCKNQQVLDDFTATDGFISDHGQKLGDEDAFLWR